MNTRHLLLSWACAALLANTVAFAKIERVVEKSFPVSPGGQLKLNTFVGPIEVQSSAEPAVRISLTEKIDASTDAEADELLRKLELSFEATGADVTVVAKYPKQEGVTGWFRKLAGPKVQLSWRVTVPSRYNLNLDTAAGSISIGDLEGDVRADTSAGSIKLGNIKGNVKADTSAASINLASATGAIDLDTSAGSIKVGTVVGPARLDTSAGSIEVARAENTVKADTSAGHIKVTFVGPIKGDCVLDTSAGGITVHVDPDAAFTLFADTSAGSVTCDLPITVQGKMKRDELSGQVNGGGPRLKLDTSAGSIRIAKR